MNAATTKPIPPTHAQRVAWLKMLVSPGSVVELRALGCVDNPKYPPYTTAGYFDADHLELMAKVAADLTGKAEGVYFTVNGCKPDLLALCANTVSQRPKFPLTSDAHVPRRRWIVFDFDPARRAADGAALPPKMSATDAEHEAARARRDVFVADRKADGWPAPLGFDSGNGFQAWYAVELPADDGGLVERSLKAAAARYSDDAVGVDTSTYNPARIFKVPGTLARKGSDTPDRRHRWCRPDHVPATLEVVPRALLEAFAGPAPEAETEPTRDNGKAHASANGARAHLIENARKYLRTIPPGVSGDKGSNPTMWAARILVWGFDLSIAEARPLMVEYSQGCTPPWSDKDIDHKLRQADTKPFGKPRGWLLDSDRGRRDEDHPRPGGDGKAKAARPRVCVSYRRDLTLASTLPLLRLDPTLYQRAGLLVCLVRETEEEAKLHGGVAMQHAAQSPRVVPISEDALSCRLPALADFYSVEKTKEGDREYPASPPNWLVGAIATHAAWPGVRQLDLIAEAPYLRRDGSIVDRPGYDAATRTLYAPSMEFPAVPEHPTQEDAHKAARTLLDVVKQFPFESDADRAVWLACVLTIMARPAIDGPAPGFAFTANKAGSGKGLLIDVAGIIGTGRKVPTTSCPVDVDETRKTITALALAGKPIVHLDNLASGSLYGNGPLDSALTTCEPNDRILGVSRTTENLTFRPTWCLSGNNVAPGKDAYRRWLPCKMLSGLEDPEERDDLEIPDLRAHVRQHRAELVRAALTILRAHAKAGRPAGWKARLGSFEEWDAIVRGAVWYATGLDCCQTRRDAAQEAPERLAKLALLEAWHDLPDGGGPKAYGLTAAEVRRMAEARTGADGKGPLQNPTLHDALAAFAKGGADLPSAAGIGNTIRGMQGAIIGRMRFEKVGEKDRAARWRVVKVNAAHPTSQAGDESNESNESDSRRSTYAGERGRAHAYAHACDRDDRNQTHQTHQTHPAADWLHAWLAGGAGDTEAATLRAGAVAGFTEAQLRAALAELGGTAQPRNGTPWWTLTDLTHSSEAAA